jgi:hypothetical protein
MNHHHASGGRRRRLWRATVIALIFGLIVAPAFAAGSVTVQVDEGGFHVSTGKPVYTMWVEVVTTVELVVAGAKVSQPIQWPQVDGLTLSGSGYNPHTNAFSFFLTPTRVGDFTVPAFDIRADDGQTLHVGPIKFHAIPHS